MSEVCSAHTEILWYLRILTVLTFGDAGLRLLLGRGLVEVIAGLIP